MNIFKGFLTALSMFSIFPVKAFWEEQYLKWVIPTFNIVGLLIGLLWFGFANIVIKLNINTEFQSILLFIIPMLLTGFIHIDGLIDTADSISSRAPLEKKREILKDPNTGAFGVIAVVLYMFFGYVIGIFVLENNSRLVSLIIIPFTARFVSSKYLLSKQTYSKNGFAETFRKDVGNTQWLFMALSTTIILGIMMYFASLSLILVFFGTALTGVLVGEYTTRQLQGISGDLCGCMIAISELVGFLLVGIF